MANVVVRGDELRLELSTLEKVAALHGDIGVPLSAVAGVEVIDHPIAAVIGVRAPGLAIPGRTKIGSWRAPRRRIFAVARAHTPAVRIDLVDQKYQQLIVSVPDAAAVAAQLAP